MNYLRFTKARVLVLVAAFALGVGLMWGAASLFQRISVWRPNAEPVSYTVLYDRMDTKIRIGVPTEITEDQLWATLRQAADDHQDDPARDYLTLSHLVVVAFLMRNDRESGEPAGELRRYVPWLNPSERKALTGDRSAYDRLSISLSRARQTLPKDR